MSGPKRAIEQVIAAEVGRPVPRQITALATHLRETWGAGVAAVLFHGSCLRDGEVEGRVADLYLLVDDYRSVHPSARTRLANTLLPPNVYHARIGADGESVRAKYSIVTIAAFERRTSARGIHPYFWARFAQPSALVWARDEAIRGRVVGALATAVRTLLAETRPLLRGRPAPRDLWIEAFARTYRCELRSEPPGRAAEIYAADADRYDLLAGMLDDHASPPAARRPGARLRWTMRRIVGKPLSVLRLIKAASTFEGGADYLLWKIERHSAARIDLTPWQRRHPFLAAPGVVWAAYRRGGIR